MTVFHWNFASLRQTLFGASHVEEQLAGIYTNNANDAEGGSNTGSLGDKYGYHYQQSYPGDLFGGDRSYAIVAHINAPGVYACWTYPENHAETGSLKLSTIGNIAAPSIYAVLIGRMEALVGSIHVMKMLRITT